MDWFQGWVGSPAVCAPGEARAGRGGNEVIGGGGSAGGIQGTVGRHSPMAQPIRVGYTARDAGTRTRCHEGGSIIGGGL